MNFKFFKGDETPRLCFTPHRYEPENVEFCFQFGDDEPEVFGNGPNECSINIRPTNDGSITFTQNSNVFKLFARERQDG